MKSQSKSWWRVWFFKQKRNWLKHWQRISSARFIHLYNLCIYGNMHVLTIRACSRPIVMTVWLMILSRDSTMSWRCLNVLPCEKQGIREQGKRKRERRIERKNKHEKKIVMLPQLKTQKHADIKQWLIRLPFCRCYTPWSLWGQPGLHTQAKIPLKLDDEMRLKWYSVHKIITFTLTDPN